MGVFESATGPETGTTLGTNLSKEGAVLQAQVDRINYGKRVPLPQRKPSKFYYIHNVSPFTWMRGMGSLGSYVIRAGCRCKICSEMTPEAASPLAIPEFIYEYKCAQWDKKFGNQPQEYREQDGLEFVLDLIGKLPPSIEDNDLTTKGVFWSEKEKPTLEEFATADGICKKYMQMLVRDANAAWHTGDRFSRLGIMGNQKYIIAAQHLLIETEWASLPKPNIPCPACGNPMPSNAIVHGGAAGCGAIINREKAEQFGLIEKPANKPVKVI
jgi:hypothetical protein